MSLEKQTTKRHLKTVRGQIDGIIQMIDDDRYCIDISNQLLASTALLKKAHLLLLEGHIAHCVNDALNNKTQSEEKLAEISSLIKKLMK